MASLTTPAITTNSNSLSFLPQSSKEWLGIFGSLWQLLPVRSFGYSMNLFLTHDKM